MSRKRIRPVAPTLPDSLEPVRNLDQNHTYENASKRTRIQDTDVRPEKQTSGLLLDDTVGVTIRTAQSNAVLPRMGAEKQTFSALMQLVELFPLQKLKYRIPAIILRHQLYTIQPNRTDVDKDIVKLFATKYIRLFNLGVMTDEVAVVMETDVTKHIRESVADKDENFQAVVERFLVEVMGNHRDVSIQANALKLDYHFNEAHITMLFNAGVLVRRDTLSYWISLPDIGIFVKNFEKGRKETLGIINRAKGKEMLESMFLKRKLRTSVLSNEYHISDIVGAELVKTSETASGTLLKLRRAK